MNRFKPKPGFLKAFERRNEKDTSNLLCNSDEELFPDESTDNALNLPNFNRTASEPIQKQQQQTPDIVASRSKSTTLPLNKNPLAQTRTANIVDDNSEVESPPLQDQLRSLATNNVKTTDSDNNPSRWKGRQHLLRKSSSERINMNQNLEEDLNYDEMSGNKNTNQRHRSMQLNNSYIGPMSQSNHGERSSSIAVDDELWDLGDSKSNIESSVRVTDSDGDIFEDMDEDDDDDDDDEEEDSSEDNISISSSSTGILSRATEAREQIEASRSLTTTAGKIPELIHPKGLDALLMTDPNKKSRTKSKGSNGFTRLIMKHLNKEEKPEKKPDNELLEATMVRINCGDGTETFAQFHIGVRGDSMNPPTDNSISALDKSTEALSKEETNSASIKSTSDSDLKYESAKKISSGRPPCDDRLTRIGEHENENKNRNCKTLMDDHNEYSDNMIKQQDQPLKHQKRGEKQARRESSVEHDGAKKIDRSSIRRESLSYPAKLCKDVSATNKTETWEHSKEQITCRDKSESVRPNHGMPENIDKRLHRELSTAAVIDSEIGNLESAESSPNSRSKRSMRRRGSITRATHCKINSTMVQSTRRGSTSFANGITDSEDKKRTKPLRSPERNAPPIEEMVSEVVGSERQRRRSIQSTPRKRTTFIEEFSWHRSSSTLNSPPATVPENKDKTTKNENKLSSEANPQILPACHVSAQDRPKSPDHTKRPPDKTDDIPTNLRRKSKVTSPKSRKMHQVEWGAQTSSQNSTERILGYEIKRGGNEKSEIPNNSTIALESAEKKKSKDFSSDNGWRKGISTRRLDVDDLPSRSLLERDIVDSGPPLSSPLRAIDQPAEGFETNPSIRRNKFDRQISYKLREVVQPRPTVTKAASEKTLSAIGNSTKSSTEYQSSLTNGILNADVAMLVKKQANPSRRDELHGSVVRSLVKDNLSPNHDETTYETNAAVELLETDEAKNNRHSLEGKSEGTVLTKSTYGPDIGDENICRSPEFNGRSRESLGFMARTMSDKNLGPRKNFERNASHMSTTRDPNAWLLTKARSSRHLGVHSSLQEDVTRPDPERRNRDHSNRKKHQDEQLSGEGHHTRRRKSKTFPEVSHSPTAEELGTSLSEIGEKAPKISRQQGRSQTKLQVKMAPPSRTQKQEIFSPSNEDTIPPTVLCDSNSENKETSTSRNEGGNTSNRRSGIGLPPHECSHLLESTDAFIEIDSSESEIESHDNPQNMLMTEGGDGYDEPKMVLDSVVSGKAAAMKSDLGLSSINMISHLKKKNPWVVATPGQVHNAQSRLLVNSSHDNLMGKDEEVNTSSAREAFNREAEFEDGSYHYKTSRTNNYMGGATILKVMEELLPSASRHSLRVTSTPLQSPSSSHSRKCKERATCDEIPDDIGGERYHSQKNEIMQAPTGEITDMTCVYSQRHEVDGNILSKAKDTSLCASEGLSVKEHGEMVKLKPSDNRPRSQHNEVARLRKIKAAPCKAKDSAESSTTKLKSYLLVNDSSESTGSGKFCNPRQASLSNIGGRDYDGEPVWESDKGGNGHHDSQWENVVSDNNEVAHSSSSRENKAQIAMSANTCTAISPIHGGLPGPGDKTLQSSSLFDSDISPSCSCPNEYDELVLEIARSKNRIIVMETKICQLRNEVARLRARLNRE